LPRPSLIKNIRKTPIRLAQTVKRGSFRSPETG
jgi:hypothetical protein